jgi:hypothetical protein
MAIRRVEPGPCWVAEIPGAEVQEHHPDRAGAREEAVEWAADQTDDHPEISPEVTALEHGCWLTVCGRCGEPIDDDEGLVHYSLREVQAADAALAAAGAGECERETCATAGQLGSCAAADGGLLPPPAAGGQGRTIAPGPDQVGFWYEPPPA